MKLPYITVPEPTTSNHERVQEILQKIYSYRGQQANSISYNGISLLLQELNEYVTVVACGTIYYEDTGLLIMLYGETASKYYLYNVILQNGCSMYTREKYLRKQNELLIHELTRSNDIFLVEEVINK